jgi:hypothetical protein
MRTCHRHFLHKKALSNFSPRNQKKGISTKKENRSSQRWDTWRLGWTILLWKMTRFISPRKTKPSTVISWVILHLLPRFCLGLGNSSISDVYYAYAQNTKEIDLYKEQISLGHFAISKGHIMSKEDIETRNLILKLICNHEADWNFCYYSVLGKRNWDKLKTFAEEGIIEFDAKGIKILPSGHPFVRNVCMVFDLRMQEKEERKFGFSKSI